MEFACFRPGEVVFNQVSCNKQHGFRPAGQKLGEEKANTLPQRVQEFEYIIWQLVFFFPPQCKDSVFKIVLLYNLGQSFL